MKLAGRIELLEKARGAPLSEALNLDLAPDILRRVKSAKASNTFPQSLFDADLKAILKASDITKEQR